jgi:hypothetical protein
MKALFKMILLLAVVAPLVACQKGENSKRGNIRRAYRGATEINRLGYNPGIPQPGYTDPNRPFSPTGGSSWGAMHAGSRLTNDEFDFYYHHFVSATMDAEMLGDVSGQVGDSTGVRFWGYAQGAGGVRINPYGSNNMNIDTANAELRIVIWDSYAGQYDSEGELVPEYPVHIRTGTSGHSVSGQISGNWAKIVFRDQYGWIELNGTFDANYFSGWAWFDNSGGSAGHLGDFYIPTCSFFRCY